MFISQTPVPAFLPAGLRQRSYYNTSRGLQSVCKGAGPALNWPGTHLTCPCRQHQANFKPRCQEGGEGPNCYRLRQKLNVFTAISPQASHFKTALKSSLTLPSEN